MSNAKEKLIEELANLLNETSEAHHKAFAALIISHACLMIFIIIRYDTPNSCAASLDAAVLWGQKIANTNISEKDGGWRSTL